MLVFPVQVLGMYLKREAPPSAITLSTLAAWQWRILKRIRIIGREGENGAVEEKKGEQLVPTRGHVGGGQDTSIRSIISFDVLT